MMIRFEEPIYKNSYLRGVLLELPKKVTILNALKSLGIKGMNPLNKGYISTFFFANNINPKDLHISNNLVQVVDSKTYFLVLVVSLPSWEGKERILLLTAYPRQLQQILNRQPRNYLKVNLPSFLSDQLKMHYQSMKVRRLNIRLIGKLEKDISSIALFGNNTLNKLMFLNILGLGKDEISYDDFDRFDPFLCPDNKISPRRIFANSCRVKIFGEKENVDVNFDHFGNFSINFLSEPTESNLVNFLSHLGQGSKFMDLTACDPMKRSKKALEEVENGYKS